jgi:hypothetical protein
MKAIAQKIKKKLKNSLFSQGFGTVSTIFPNPIHVPTVSCFSKVATLAEILT